MIAYTVFALHRSCGITYTLTLPLGTNPAIVAQTQLFFSVTGSLLLVYAPGLVIQLVDCGVEHEPCHCLSFYGEV